MDERGGAGVLSLSADVTEFAPDTLYMQVEGLPIFPKNEEGNPDLDASVMDSELGKVKMNMYLKNSLGKDIQIVNNVPLALFALMSDYNGASAYANSADYEGTVTAGKFAKGKQIAIPLGDIVLRDGDILTVSMQGSVTAENWAIRAWLANDVTLTKEIILTYAAVKGLDSQTFSFRNAMQVSFYGDTDSETTVTDYFGTVAVDYKGAITMALCNGQYEYTDGQHKAPYGVAWEDFTKWAQDISFTTVSGVSYLVVGRAFAPERMSRADKDIRNVTAFKDSILADNPDKAQILFG